MLGFLFLSIIPVVGFLVSSLVINNVDTQLNRDGLPNIDDICSGTQRVLVEDACQNIDNLQLMSNTSVGLIVSFLVFFAVVVSLSKLAGSNRSLNATIFPILIPSSLLFISASIIIEGVVISYALFELQVFLMERWFPVVTIGIGLGAAAVAFGVIGSAFSFKTKSEITQRALLLDNKESSIWSFVTKIAETTSSPVPDNIVLGLEPNFYATGADVTALSSNKTVSGETLYLSLPLMRLFSKDEFAAVIGHELGHFKGGDAKYTLKFAPVYRALSDSINSVSETESLLSIPAVGALSFLYNAFEKNEKTISREREFEADKIGAEASSPEALLQALVKLTVFSGHWSRLQLEIIENLKLGRPVNNMSQLYAASVSYDTKLDEAKDVAKSCAKAVVSHPTDTHPSTGERANSLQVSQNTIEQTDLNIPEEQSISLLEGYLEIEELLTTDEQKLYIALGVDYEAAMPEEDNPYAVARIGQTAAALMVCADGKVELSEIEEAEKIGEEILPYFNTLEFRELCLNPNNLPNIDSFSEALASLPNDFVEILLDYLDRIANSDGELDKNEEKYLKKLKGYLKSK